MNNIKFTNRDFLALPPNAWMDWNVKRYSWKAVGGPDTAILSAPVTVDKWDVFKMLRYGVEISDQGRCVWWGYVHKITIPHGKLKVGLSLDTMYNSVAASYSNMEGGVTVSSGQALTAFSADAMSVAEFGTKQYIASLSNATATQAAARLATLLSTNKYPIATVEMSAGAEIELECRGWWETIGWKYYSNASTTPTETTAQAAAIIAAAGQFIVQANIITASGVTTNPFRDSQVNALTELETVLKNGTSTGTKLLATVARDRSVFISAVPAQSAKYYMDQSGQLVYMQNKNMRIEPSCVAGVWVALKDVPLVVGGMTNIKEFFIESADYTEATGITTYKPIGQTDMMNVTGIV